MLNFTMTSQKNHDTQNESYLRHDVKRLAVTAVVTLVVLVAVTYWERQTHFIEHFIVLPAQNAVVEPVDEQNIEPVPAASAIPEETLE